MTRRLDGEVSRVVSTCFQAVDASQETTRAAMALGLRRWKDVEHAFGEGIEPLRVARMARLPAAIARRRADPALGYLDEYDLVDVEMLLASPPDDSGDEPRAEAIRQLQTRWATEGETEFTPWAVRRCVFGADDGAAMHERCWTQEDNTWAVSDEVISSAAGHPVTRSDQPPLGPGDLRRLETSLQSLNPLLGIALLCLASPSPEPPEGPMTFLELALLIDPSDDPPWLSTAGRRALLRGYVDEVPAGASLSECSAREVAVMQVYRRSAPAVRSRLESEGDTALGHRLSQQTRQAATAP